MRAKARVLLAWGIAAALLLPLGLGLESRLEVQARVEGAEYLGVSEILAREFSSPFGDSLVLVVNGLNAGDAVSLSEILDIVVDEVERDPSVEQTLSYRDTNDPLFLGEDGGGAIVLVRVKKEARAASLEGTLTRLRARAVDLSMRLRMVSPGVSIRWTGESALNSDLRNVSSREAREGELRVLPLILLALIAAFGSLIASALPIGIGIVSIPMTLVIAAIFALFFPLSVVLVNVVTMLGLGLGVDYALLMVSRFREELRRNESIVTDWAIVMIQLRNPAGEVRWWMDRPDNRSRKPSSP